MMPSRTSARWRNCVAAMPIGRKLPCGGPRACLPDDALQQHVIEIVAKDVPDLLRQLQGRKVKATDHEMVLDTQGLAVRRIAPDWRTRVLWY